MYTNPCSICNRPRMTTHRKPIPCIQCFHAARKIPAATRLQRMKAVSASGCHEFTGCRDRNGYGTITINRKNVYAHRFSWESTHGPIPAGMKVLHKCDNPSCINPQHLFLGTQKDNIADRIAKGRRGTQPTRRKRRVELPAEQVKAA